MIHIAFLLVLIECSILVAQITTTIQGTNSNMYTNTIPANTKQSKTIPIFKGKLIENGYCTFNV